MRLFIFLMILTVVSLPSFAQRHCGTSGYFSVAVGNSDNQDNISGKRRDTISDEIIIIPVVVHVLYRSAAQNISDAQIQSQIDCLNRDFNHLNSDTLNTPSAFRVRAAGCGIKFCLARVDPDGRLTSGIIRKNTYVDAFLGDDGMKFSGTGGSNAWDSRRYLNIWVCNMSGRSLGYATFPGGPVEKDGIVINYDVFGTKGSLRAPFNKGRTATHEVGHWLGLNHIWGDALCGDDGIHDTPRQKSYNFGCPSFPRVTNCSPDVNGDMFMNFMDFSDDACMNIFTLGQRSRMRGQFSLNGLRNTFLDTGSCDSVNATAGPAPEEGPVTTIPAPAFDFTAGPNPAVSYIIVKGSSGSDITGRKFRIFNVHGQPVKEFTCTAEGQQVDVSSLVRGLYLIVADFGSTRVVRKFVKG